MNHIYFMARKCESGKDFFRCYNAVDLFARSEMFTRGRIHPVQIRVGETYLETMVDMDLTVFPGREYAVCISDGTVPARVVYLGDGRHRLIWNRVELEVRYRNLRWKFFLGGKHLASMIPVDAADPIGAILKGRWTPRYTMMSRAELPEILAALMLHFPMLQIGI